MIQRSNNSGMCEDAGQVGSVAMQAELAVWGGWGCRTGGSVAMQAELAVWGGWDA